MSKSTNGLSKRPFAQDFSGDTLTQQHFKDSCDVNNIVAAYQNTGIDPYADRITNQKFGYASSQSFEEALRATAEVNSAFADLPSAERSRFSNSPAQWLDHITTPEETTEEIIPPEAAQEASASPETPVPDKDA